MGREAEVVEFVSAWNLLAAFSEYRRRPFVLIQAQCDQRPVSHTGCRYTIYHTILSWYCSLLYRGSLHVTRRTERDTLREWKVY